MIKIHGKSAYPYIAIGELHFSKKKQSLHYCRKPNDVDSELSLFHQASNIASKELNSLWKKAVSEIGSDKAEIFRSYNTMLNDDEFRSTVEKSIKFNSMNVEFAIETAADIFSKIFSENKNKFLKLRSGDIKYISSRLIRIIDGEQSNTEKTSNPYIMVTDNISPSEMLNIDKSKILGIVTYNGSENSHESIIAGSRKIPALSGTETLDSSFEGQIAILDGNSGVLYINPGKELIAQYQKKLCLNHQSLYTHNQLKGKPTVTQDGKKIDLFANINTPSEINNAMQNDAEGIGLFRSEFLFIGRNLPPTEEEQFKTYKNISTKMKIKKVIIRTADLSSEQNFLYFKQRNEENPALGCRGIRTSLKHQHTFKTQLRAILRASAFGRLSIMFPMVTSENEVHRIRTVLDEVKRDLKFENIPFDENIEYGIMIETPAAALISDKLAELCDFFCIGSNDLTQYVLAADRKNSDVSDIYNSRHKAISRLIKTVIRNAHHAGIQVGICGELASDTSYTEGFIKDDIDMLSVSPTDILKIREKVRSIKLGTSKKRDSDLPSIIVKGLGGKSNINTLDYCSTRLRVKVRDFLLVDDETLMKSGASYIVHKGNSIHIIYNNKALHTLKNEIDEYIDSF